MPPDQVDSRLDGAALDPLVSLTVRLHFDTGGRPIGSVRSSEGEASSFVGWLALMAECSRLLAGYPEAPEQP